MRLICLCCTHAAFAWFYCLSSFEFKVSKFKFKRMCLNPLCQKNLSLFSPPPLSAQTGPVSFLLAQPGASPSLPSFLSFLPRAAHSRRPNSRPKPPPLFYPFLTHSRTGPACQGRLLLVRNQDSLPSPGAARAAVSLGAHAKTRGRPYL